MKISAIALTILFAAVPASGEGVILYRDNFIEQCCITNTTAPAGFDDTFELLISGYTSSECTSVCPGAVSLEWLCQNPPVGATYFPGELCPDGLNCCATGDPNDVIADGPWSCATAINSFNGLSGAKGFYCGATAFCKKDGTVCGDPHFQTWEGGWFDFHGACDLVFVKDEEFSKGLGLAIHLRTTARYEYSYVETAAIQIGDDVFEVSAYGNYFMNGVEHAKLDEIKMGGLFRVEYEEADKKTHTYNIIVSEGKHQGTESIQIKTFKDLVSVKFNNAYEDSFASTVGMMGNYHTGAKLARDGKTLIEDANEFGMEWQVRPEEPMLFQAVREPQLSSGQQCVMPSKSAAVERRRLGEGVPLEAAVAACEAVDHIHHENCIYDVMATGDLEIVHAGVF